MAQEIFPDWDISVLVCKSKLCVTNRINRQEMMLSRVRFCTCGAYIFRMIDSTSYQLKSK